jgi:hypothetical protein
MSSEYIYTSLQSCKALSETPRLKGILQFAYFFFNNLNQQSEFTFYKLMCLLQCLDGESSSGESPVPQITSICQFPLSCLFSSLTSSVLRRGFSWVSSVVWCLLHFLWMTSCTYDMPRSACSVALETYHGASTIILKILDWLLWITDIRLHKWDFLIFNWHIKLRCSERLYRRSNFLERVYVVLLCSLKLSRNFNFL